MRYYEFVNVYTYNSQIKVKCIETQYFVGVY